MQFNSMRTPILLTITLTNIYLCTTSLYLLQQKQHGSSDQMFKYTTHFLEQIIEIIWKTTATCETIASFRRLDLNLFILANTKVGQKFLTFWMKESFCDKKNFQTLILRPTFLQLVDIFKNDESFRCSQIGVWEMISSLEYSL